MSSWKFKSGVQWPVDILARLTASEISVYFFHVLKDRCSSGWIECVHKVDSV